MDGPTASTAASWARRIWSLPRFDISTTRSTNFTPLFGTATSSSMPNRILSRLTFSLQIYPRASLAWRMEELRLQKRIAYDIHANWKLIVANYNECLHCPVLHPALNRLTDYLGSDNEAHSPLTSAAQWVFAGPRKR